MPSQAVARRPCRRRSSRSTRIGRPVARIDAAERDVVHRPLARRRQPLRAAPCQRAEHDVGDPLRRLDVAAGDGGRPRGVDDRAFAARSPCSGRGDAGVVEHVVAHETAERVEAWPTA